MTYKKIQSITILETKIVHRGEAELRKHWREHEKSSSRVLRSAIGKSKNKCVDSDSTH